MKTKGKLMVSIGAAVGVCAAIFLGTGAAKKSTDISEHLQNIKDFRDIAGRAESALVEQGWDMDTTRREVLIPLSWADEEGNRITFYNYNVQNPEASDDPIALYEICDPNTARSSTPCKVKGYNAILYQQDDLSYLWWSPAEDTILLIEYNPAAVEDAEIIRMAESVDKVDLN